MKLFVMKNKKDEVIAISEYKKLIFSFIVENDYSKEDVDIYIITDKDKFNHYILNYEEYLLESYRNMTLTTREVNLIRKSMHEELFRLQASIDDLTYIIDNYNIKPKHMVAIEKCIDILDSYTKPKRLNKLLGLYEFIIDIRNFNNEKYNEFFSPYNIKTNLDK